MKRLAFALISGAMGALVGLLLALLTGRTSAILVCGVLGAALTLIVRPSKEA